MANKKQIKRNKFIKKYILPYESKELIIQYLGGSID